MPPESVTSRNYDTDSFSRVVQSAETRDCVYDWLVAEPKLIMMELPQGYRIFDGLDMGDVARSFWRLQEDLHEHPWASGATPIDGSHCYPSCLGFSRDTSNAHTVRIAIFSP